MKNSFKMGALALVIAVSFAACKGKGSAGADSTVKVDSTVKTDSTVVKVDTMKKDTMKKDTAKKM
jgi:ABC-type glycerol-3-phosphate transport system substrate-binding protein